MKAHPALLAQAEQTKKDVIKLGDGIYTAVGFAASNVHMVEGKTSITIIDTTEQQRRLKIFWRLLERYRKSQSRRLSTPIATVIISQVRVFSVKAMISLFWHLICLNQTLSMLTRM